MLGAVTRLGRFHPSLESRIHFVSKNHDPTHAELQSHQELAVTFVRLTRMEDDF